VSAAVLFSSVCAYSFVLLDYDGLTTSPSQMLIQN